MSLTYDVYNTPHLKNVFIEIGQRVKRGERFVLRFDKVIKRKSHRQLRNLFGNIITPLARFLSAEYGNNIDVQALERSLAAEYSARDDNPAVTYGFDFKTMQPTVIPTRLSEMSVAQAGEFTDWCIKYIREKFSDLSLPPYIDYLWMNNLTEKKIEQVVCESRMWQERDRQYLDFVRCKPCIVCGRSSQRCEAHHLNDITLGGGMAKKVPDYYAVPLCRDCHQALHDNGTNELVELIEPVLHGHELRIFCKMCYYRWREHL